MGTDNTKIDDLREKAASTGAELSEKLTSKFDETKVAAKDAVTSARQHAAEPVQKVLDRVAPEPVPAERGGAGKKLVVGGVIAALLVIVLRGLNPK